MRPEFFSVIFIEFTEDASDVLRRMADELDWLAADAGGPKDIKDAIDPAALSTQLNFVRASVGGLNGGCALAVYPEVPNARLNLGRPRLREFAGREAAILRAPRAAR